MGNDVEVCKRARPVTDYQPPRRRHDILNGGRAGDQTGRHVEVFETWILRGSRSERAVRPIQRSRHALGLTAFALGRSPPDRMMRSPVRRPRPEDRSHPRSSGRHGHVCPTGGFGHGLGIACLSMTNWSRTVDPQDRGARGDAACDGLHQHKIIHSSIKRAGGWMARAFVRLREVVRDGRVGR